jgi:hypothetical protein
MPAAIAAVSRSAPPAAISARPPRACGRLCRARRQGRRAERRVVSEDALLERAQLGTRFQPQLVQR